MAAFGEIKKEVISFDLQDKSPDISLNTREFLVARLNEMVLATCNVFYAFTSHDASQYVAIKRPSTKLEDGTQLFSGKLALALSSSHVSKISLPVTPLKKEIGPNTFKAVMGMMLTVRNVVQFITFIWHHLDMANRSGKKGPKADEVNLANAFVKRVASDLPLVAELRRVCAIFLDRGPYNRFSTYVLHAYATRKNATPDIDPADFDEFVKVILLITRVMTKILLNCQRIIPFMSIYGFSEPNPKDPSSTVPATITRLLETAYSTYNDTYPELERYRQISLDPRFFAACSPSSKNLCPYFQEFDPSLDSEDLLLGWYPKRFFLNDVRVAIAYMYSRFVQIKPANPAFVTTSTQGNASHHYQLLMSFLRPKEKNFESVFETLAKSLLSIFRKTLGEKYVAYDDKPPSVFAREMNPVFARKFYTRGISALYSSKDSGGKTVADRIMIIRRIILITARVEALLINNPIPESLNSSIDGILSTLSDTMIRTGALTIDPALKDGITLKLMIR